MHYADRRQGLELPTGAWDVQAGKRLPEKLLGILQRERKSRRGARSVLLPHPGLLLGVIHQSNQYLSAYYVPGTILVWEHQ